MKIIVYLEPKFERPEDADSTAVCTNISDEGKAGIEAALQMKEKLGGEVTAVTVGQEPDERVLREAFAMGVDAAAIASGVEPTLENIAAAIKKLAGNVVLNGYAGRKELGHQLGLAEAEYKMGMDAKGQFISVAADSVKPRYMSVGGVYAAYKHPITQLI